MDSYAWTGSLGEPVSIGITPIGLRLNVPFNGTVTADGEMNGAEVRGVDYLTIRPDGISVINAHEAIISNNGSSVQNALAIGYIVPPFEMPPLEAMLEADFKWPDADLPMHGAITFESGQKGSPLNRTVYAFTGKVNVGLGQISVSAKAIV